MITDNAIYQQLNVWDAGLYQSTCLSLQHFSTYQELGEPLLMGVKRPFLTSAFAFQREDGLPGAGDTGRGGGECVRRRALFTWFSRLPDPPGWTHGATPFPPNISWQATTNTVAK